MSDVERRLASGERVLPKKMQTVTVEMFDLTAKDLKDRAQAAPDSNPHKKIFLNAVKGMKPNTVVTVRADQLQSLSGKTPAKPAEQK